MEKLIEKVVPYNEDIIKRENCLVIEKYNIYLKMNYVDNNYDILNRIVRKNYFKRFLSRYYFNRMIFKKVFNLYFDNNLADCLAKEYITYLYPSTDELF